uniref:Uncharacterized protein n=2 Tax=Amphimedon queenslandica TaxID=400682 RepID=A0A1X7VRE7_AMPQE
MVPKLKFEHIHLTPFSVRVDLAAQEDFDAAAPKRDSESDDFDETTEVTPLHSPTKDPDFNLDTPKICNSGIVIELAMLVSAGTKQFGYHTLTLMCHSKGATLFHEILQNGVPPPTPPRGPLLPLPPGGLPPPPPDDASPPRPPPPPPIPPPPPVAGGHPPSAGGPSPLPHAAAAFHPTGDVSALQRQRQILIWLLQLNRQI